jgi:acyl carrier protein
MSSTLERLGAILAKDYKLTRERLTLDATLDSLGIDSLGLVELLWNVEDEFQIKLPAEPEALTTLGDVIRLIEELVARQHPLATPQAP